ncbi:MAG: DUF262 domain-containing protein [Vampirovibrionales bacterium]|nr:DUF262 domain-containing protein [Vampirovibrionales bacterium]
MKILLEQITQKRNELKTDNYVITWNELITMYKDNTLNISPQFQRMFRWSIEQQSVFIESILLGIPIPPIFLFEEKDSTKTVIDGLQRVSTVIKFFSNESTPSQKKVDSNDVAVPPVLTRGRIIESLEGQTPMSLPVELIRAIKYSRIPVIELERDTNEEVRYEVFIRLNRQGTDLTDQELRNCAVRLASNEFADSLIELANDPIVNEALKFSPKMRSGMYVEELILRSLAMAYDVKSYEGSLTDFLDKFMLKATNRKELLPSGWKDRILIMFKLVSETIGSKAFKRNGVFSPGLFEIVSVGAFLKLNQKNIRLLQPAWKELIDSKELSDCIGSGSNAKAKVLKRYNLAIGLLS